MYVPNAGASHQPDTQVVKHLHFILSGGYHFVTAWRKQMFSLHPVAPEIGAQFQFGRTEEKTEPLDVRYVSLPYLSFELHNRKTPVNTLLHKLWSNIVVNEPSSHDKLETKHFGYLAITI